MKKAALVTAAAAVVLCSSIAFTAERSFVGRRLSGVKFVDTEGHTIDPNHYRGSVLVMFSGIPW